MYFKSSNYNMLKNLIQFIILFVGLCAVAQNKFQKGYIMTTNGQKINCYILNEDFFNTPEKFKYKLSLDSEVKTILASRLQSLLIESHLKYQRHSVKIDKSSDFIDELSLTRLSEFEDANLLLKVLVEGKTDLLSYSTSKFKRFFYKKEGILYPLEYKRYKTKINTVGENLNYQIQLKDNFNCESRTWSNISYNEKSLVKFFTEYNSCKGSSNINYYLRNESRKPIINLRGKAGLGISKVKNLESGIDLESKQIFKIGLEFEYNLPLNNYKWSLFIEPTFQTKYSSEFKFPVGSGEVPSSGVITLIYGDASVNFSSIDLPIGIRYYIIDKTLFINAGVNTFFPVDREIIKNNPLSNETTSIRINSNIGFLTGIGYLINNKFSLELRYNTYELIYERTGRTNVPFNSNNISFKVGYNFLN